MFLASMGVILGLGFSKAQFTIGLLLLIVHPVGGAEPIVGALQVERYGGQIIEEMEHDYPTLRLNKTREVIKMSYKDEIQEHADELASQLYDKDFYDLPEKLRDEVYEKACAMYADDFASQADSLQGN